MTLPLCPCGAEAIAHAPGTAPTYAPGGIVITTGAPSRAYCLAHWPWRLAGALGALGLAAGWRAASGPKP